MIAVASKKAEALSKLVWFSTVAADNLTILVTVAPLPVKVDAVALAAWAVVNVTAPGVSLPIVALAVPKVALTPLMVAAERVATLD